MLSPMDTKDTIGVGAWSPCDHDGRRRLVAMKRKKTTLVANVKQYALTRAAQETECRELQEAIQCRNERYKRLMSLLERKQKLLREVLECLEKNMTTGSTAKVGGPKKFICWDPPPFFIVTFFARKKRQGPIK